MRKHDSVLAFRRWLICCAAVAAASPGLTEELLRETTKSLGAVPEKASFITVSPDGHRLAAIIPQRSASKQVLLGQLNLAGLEANPAQIWIDGRLGPEYRLIAAPTFSPDSQRFAYLAMLPSERYPGERPPELPSHIGPFQVVVDGVGGPIYPLVIPPLESRFFVFSPDSKRLAFQVPKSDEAAVLIIEGEEVGIFAGAIYSVVFSPDGAHQILTAGEGKKKSVVLDGKNLGTFDNVGVPTFSPDSRRLAYVVRRGRKWSAVFDGKKFGKFRWAWNPVVSPDSEHIAYWASDGTNKIMMLDDQPLGRGEFLEHSSSKLQFIETLGPVFSPDSSRLAFVLKAGKNSNLVIGEETKTYTKALPFAPSFSPEGERFAYALFKDTEETIYAVVDGSEQPSGFRCANRLILGSGLGVFTMIAPRFSPDGRHAAFLRTRKAKNWHEGGPNLQVVIDGVGSSYFDLVHSMTWQSENTLQAIVRRGVEYLRVELQAPNG